MATSIDQAEINHYGREVHETYQREGSLLRMTVRRRTNIVGATTTFQKVGTGKAVTKARHGVIAAMNVDHTPVSCSLANHYAGDWHDEADKMITNIDEREVLVNAGAYAIGRKSDDLIITALDTTTNVVVDSSDSLTLAKLKSAMKTLGQNSVFRAGAGQRWCIVPFAGWVQLLSIPQFSSADYTGPNMPFLDGVEKKTYLGTTFMPHEGLDEVVSGGIYKAYWYHTSAVGHAAGNEITPDITWHGDRASWWIMNWMRQGACLVDARGVVEIQFIDV